MRNRLVKYGAIGYILNATIYLITEFIAALGTNQDLGYVSTLSNSSVRWECILDKSPMVYQTIFHPLL